MDIHQDGDAASSLSQDHRPPRLVNVFNKRRPFGPELRQGADILIHAYFRHGDL
jgi:hypothetical protein